jgi:hypothetical protein
LPGVRQSHRQPVASQRHPFFGHPQEQVAQSHVPQQVAFAAASLVVLFWFVIVFSLFLSAPHALSKGLTSVP